MQTNYKNLISDKPVKLIIPIGSDAKISAGDKEEFDIVLLHDKVKTTGNKMTLQSGEFTFIKKK